MELKSNIDSVEVIIFFNESLFCLVNMINKYWQRVTTKESSKDVLFIFESSLHMPELKYDKHSLVPVNKHTPV